MIFIIYYKANPHFVASRLGQLKNLLFIIYDPKKKRIICFPSMQFSNFVFFAYIIIPENLMSCKTCDSNLANYHENGDDGDDGDEN